GDSAGEAAMAAVGIEPQKMVAVRIRFGRPEFADIAAGQERGNLVGHRSVSFFTSMPSMFRPSLRLRLAVLTPHSAAARHLYGATQQKYEAKHWPAGGKSAKNAWQATAYRLLEIVFAAVYAAR